MKPFTWMLTACTCLTIGTERGRADLIALTSSSDNTLIELPSSDHPQLSNGSGPSVFVGRTNQSAGNAKRRGAIWFDLSEIAPGSHINSVSLTLRVTQGLNNQGQTIDLFPLLSSFGEGSSFALGGAGDAAAPPDATWFYNAFAASLWATPGGDFGALASASAAITPGMDTLTWTGSGLVSDVQAWVDGTQANLCWLLRGNETVGGTARGFGTRENTNADLRPVLTIDYTPPVSAVPAPSGLILLATGALGLLGSLRWRRRSADGLDRPM